MKKAISLLIMVFLLSTAINAAVVNFVKEINSIKEYYSKEKILSSMNGAVVLSSVGVKYYQSKGFIPSTNQKLLDNEQTKISAAINLCYEAFAYGKTPDSYLKGKNLLNIIAKSQGKNGSFGSFYKTLNSIIILKSQKKQFDEKKALDFLLQHQNKDGGFSFEIAMESDLYTTSNTLCVLSFFKNNEKITESISKGINYEKNNIETSQQVIDENIKKTNIISMTIMALIDNGENLKNSKWNYLWDIIATNRNQDGSYRNTSIDQKIFNDIATYSALSAFDSVENGNSYIYRLLLNGNLYPKKFNTWIILLVCIVIIIFIIYIRLMFMVKQKKKLIKIKSY